VSFNAEIKKGYDLDFSFENTVIMPVASPNTRVNGKTVIGFFNMSIVNNNTFSSTIKEIDLFVKLDNKWVEGQLFNITTGKIPSGKSSAICSNNIDNIVLIDWQNIKLVISEGKTLMPGAILKSSAIFLFSQSISEIKNIKEIKVVIRDYSRNESVKTVKVEKKLTMLSDKGFKFIDKNFISDGKQNIQWINE
jgi:hypothetical protein